MLNMEKVKERCADCAYLVEGETFDGEWFCDNYNRPCAEVNEGDCKVFCGEKYIIREVPAEYSDLSFYFDDDYVKGLMTLFKSR
mgnify:CR=1 FL=1